MGKVVLFNHPGGEHKPQASGEVFPWNTGEHRRKYLSVQAQVAVADDGGFRLDSAPKSSSFWGEFEAPTLAHRFNAVTEPGMPEWWHTLLPIGTAPPGAQNSDPWVFGPTFRYVYCRQTTKATSYLKDLIHGDLLLFGSYKERGAPKKSGKVFGFYLDTVFVVDEPHHPSEKTGRPRSLFDPAHLRATYNRLPTGNRDLCTFYTGAMLGRSRSKLPFCFVPGVLSQEATPSRMRRPLISDLFRGGTGNPQVVEHWEEKSTSDAWKKVRDRCLEQGLTLVARVEDAVLDPLQGDGGAPGGECE